MGTHYKKIDKHIYRAEYGQYYDDFTVGNIYQHRPGRTITESDNTWFSVLTMNTHPIHFDKEYAKATQFEKVLVFSGLTVSIIGGMSVSDISQKAIANLGWDDIKMTAPVHVGDTLYAETEILSKRDSKKYPNAGIVRVKTIGKNQHGEIVCTYIRAILIPKIGHAIDDKISY